MLRILALSGGLIGAGVLLTAAAPPQKDNAQLQKAFSGTIISTYPDGRTAKLWMKPSGDFISEGRRHERHTGHWKLSGDKVCFRRGLFGYCTKIPTDGNAFTTRAVTGETIRVRLAPGRQGESAD
ncbi:MAG: hypothetical protein JSS35_12670 [Proteobacteria bacterium]|nr:hypothetical protein [Pseudomonadota bacterium]